MKTYVQCPYCLGYNTYHSPLLKNLDGTFKEMMPPQTIERFSGINCTPKQWLSIVQTKNNTGGFCVHCQARFLVKSNLIVRVGSDSPERRLNDFSMQIEDCFWVDAIGHDKTIVTGKIIDGCVQVGDTVIVHSELKDKKATICGIEMFGKLLPEAEFGDNCGLILSINKADVRPGDFLSKL